MPLLPKPSMFQIWPLPCSFMPARATLLANSMPVRLVLTMASKSAAGCSQSGARWMLMPALLIQTSTRPKASAAQRHRACRSSWRLTSPAQPASRSASALAANSPTAKSTASWRRPFTTTLQPRVRKPSAKPRPMPRVLPVMTTVFIIHLLKSCASWQGGCAASSWCGYCQLVEAKHVRHLL